MIEKTIKGTCEHPSHFKDTIDEVDLESSLPDDAATSATFNTSLWTANTLDNIESRAVGEGLENSAREGTIVNQPQLDMAMMSPLSHNFHYGTEYDPLHPNLSWPA